MTEIAERLKSELKLLSHRERAELAHFLILSLEQEQDEDTESAWDLELARRVEEIKSGKTFGKPADQVFSRLRETYA